jgi:predicted alpha/beta superfamily hydrolase
MKNIVTIASLAAMTSMFSSLQAATPADAQHIAAAQEISIPNSYVRTITSHKNGVTYRLSIFLPKGYDPADAKRYPVFYFIPGDAFGVYVSQIARFLASGDIPKMIIVGVDFPPDDSYSMDLPTAGPDSHWNVPENRGAANFLDIMRTEIKPFVDAHFPTDPKDSGIGGHSLGGFFALYAMLHAPETFHHVFASSPSLVWQKFVLLRDEAALAGRVHDLPVRAFVDQGGQESDDGRLAAFDKAIRSRHYPSLRWEARRTPGQTHQTIAFADGIDALYFIYGPEPRAVTDAELSSLAGEWVASDGARFRLKADHGRLYAQNFRSDGDETVELLSSQPNEWVIRYLWYRLTIDPASTGPQTMTIHLQDTPGPNGATKTPILKATRTGP